MISWQDFEILCTKYLNEKFHRYAVFIRQGKSNSRISDILVKTRKGDSFFVEAKHSPAQCGQFALLPDRENKKFEYSPRNVLPLNTYSKAIMDYMDDKFELFRYAGTSGQNIDIPDKMHVFSRWIIEMYKHKNVRFFITNDFAIFPIDKFQHYFDIEATYRIKRSGSSTPGKNILPLLKDYIENNYSVNNFLVEGKKFFVSSPQQLNGKKFTLDGHEFMFSLKQDKYEIRKLSNTRNANVIFSVEYKTGVKGLTDQEFIDLLT